MRTYTADEVDEMIGRALAREREKQAEQAQPVAWANPNDLQSFDMKVRTNGGPLHTVPLYTAPPPRQPLPYNKEDMDGLDINQRLGFKLGWKSAEEAHGIKGQQ